MGALPVQLGWPGPEARSQGWSSGHRGGPPRHPRGGLSLPSPRALCQSHVSPIMTSSWGLIPQRPSSPRGSRVCILPDGDDFFAKQLPEGWP